MQRVMHGIHVAGAITILSICSQIPDSIWSLTWEVFVIFRFDYWIMWFSNRIHLHKRVHIHTNSLSLSSLSLTCCRFLLTVCPWAVLIKLMQTSLTERTKQLTLQRCGNAGPNNREAVVMQMRSSWERGRPPGSLGRGPANGSLM